MASLTSTRGGLRPRMERMSAYARPKAERWLLPKALTALAAAFRIWSCCAKVLFVPLSRALESPPPDGWRVLADRLQGRVQQDRG